jgi:hypothetical protein
MADKRLKIFDALCTSQALFVSTPPRLKDDGHQRYEVFRRTAATYCVAATLLLHLSRKRQEIQMDFPGRRRFSKLNILFTHKIATGR